MIEGKPWINNYFEMFFFISVEGATLGVPVPIIDGKHIIIHVIIIIIIAIFLKAKTW